MSVLPPEKRTDRIGSFAETTADRSGTEIIEPIRPISARFPFQTAPIEAATTLVVQTAPERV